MEGGAYSVIDTKIDLRHTAAEIQRAALLAADPAEAIRRHVRRVTDWLLVGNVQYHLPEIERVFVIAIGKAAVAMDDAYHFFAPLGDLSSLVQQEQMSTIFCSSLSNDEGRREMSWRFILVPTAGELSSATSSPSKTSAR
jgi:hypothetical protein